MIFPRDYSETTREIVKSNYFFYNTVNIVYFSAKTPENISSFVICVIAFTAK